MQIVLYVVLLQFAMADTKCYAPVVTLSTQDSTKLLEQLKSDFKITITWEKHQSKVQLNQYFLNYLIDPSFL